MINQFKLFVLWTLTPILGGTIAQGLPNVLIYGDSISGGYAPFVAETLKNKANLYRPLPHDNWDSAHLLEYIQELTKAHGVKFDVIHFNVGLHDMKRYNSDGKKDAMNGSLQVSYAAYRTNLEAAIQWMKKAHPNARIIFATTTPVPAGEKRRRVADPIEFNAIASHLLQDFPEIVVNDLYSFVKPNHRSWWREPGDVHYTETGYRTLAEKVSNAIIEQIEAN